MLYCTFMNVYPTKNIAFKAIFISSPNIEKVTKNRINNHKVSFVEIDVRNTKDIDALEYIAANWDQGRSYAANIYITMHILSIRIHI